MDYNFMNMYDADGSLIGCNTDWDSFENFVDIERIFLQRRNDYRKAIGFSTKSRNIKDTRLGVFGP